MLRRFRKKAGNLLKQHNREKVSLSVQAIGDMRVRAGNFIYVLLDEFQTQLFLVDQCSHKNFRRGAYDVPRH
ncbi:hypothetical protein ACFTAO_41845 [Paenibacillus rhizoplanae]